MNINEIEIDDSKITEEQLEALYIYLSMSYETMTNDEKQAWYHIMEKIDKDFYDQD